MRRCVLVIGASGFIGRRIVAALAKSAWATPIAAARNAPTNMPAGVESISLDTTNARDVLAALQHTDVVINSVAGDSDTIVGGARILFEAAQQTSTLPRIVHLSSMAVYGSARGTVDESAPLLGDLDAYGAAKIRAESFARVYKNTVILRPGIVYGPHSTWWSDRIARLLISRRWGDLGDGGRGICNLVYVEDVASAVLQAVLIPNATGEVANLAAPNQPTWNEYFARYAAALGVTPMRHISPTRLQMELKVMGPILKLLEMTARKSTTPPPIRPWFVNMCKHDIRLNVARAERILGITSTPLDRGLAETAQWFLRSRQPLY